MWRISAAHSNSWIKEAMMQRKIRLCVYIFFSIVISFTSMGEDLEGRKHFSEHLFEATFAIQGNNGGFGTGFCIQCESLRSVYLITARHVLDSMLGDSVTIFFRKQIDDGLYRPIPHQILIKDSLGSHYKVHFDPAIDVAVLKLTLPSDSLFLSQFLPFSPSSFATDEDVRKYWIHPGDKLFYLGFPLITSSLGKGLFPILRSGYVASYPILPLNKHPLIYLDGPVYEGNSGGPVYFEYGASSWNTKTVNTCGKIIGIIKGYRPITFKRKIDSLEKIHDIELGGFINSSYILELLDSLGCN